MTSALTSQPRPLLRSRVLWVCVIIAVTIVTVSAFGAQRVIKAARQLADGEGDLLVTRVADAIHSSDAPLTADLLDTIVEDNAGRGLVFITIDRRGPRFAERFDNATGRVASRQASEGAAQVISRLLPPPPSDGAMASGESSMNRGSRAGRPPPDHRRGGPPPPRGGPRGAFLDDDGAPRRGPRDGPRDGPPEFREGRPPPPGLAGPGLPMVTVGFTGLAAAGAEQQAAIQLLFALFAAVFVVALGVGFARSDQRRDRLQIALREQQLLASLGEMSAVLAHEIRNPLGAIKGHAQLLVEDLDDRKADQDRAERLVREAVRLESIVSNLLTFVRSGELARTPTPLLPVIHDAITRAAAVDVTIENGVGEDLSLSIDPGRFGLAVDNIVNNAMAAGSGALHISLSTAPAIGRALSSVSIVIEDDGPGIDAAVKDRLFDPFVTSKTKGTGLGLALSARIIEAHGGQLSLTQSVALKGAAFEILIPCEVQPLPPKETA